MKRSASIRVNGSVVVVDATQTLAAALLDAGFTGFRSSVNAESRAPLCGMGICFECRVTVDGAPHVRSCLLPVRDGMTVELES